jgi:hypothetical protein
MMAFLKRLPQNLRLQAGIDFPDITTQPIVFTSDFTPIILTDVGPALPSTRIIEHAW